MALEQQHKRYLERYLGHVLVCICFLATTLANNRRLREQTLGPTEKLNEEQGETSLSRRHLTTQNGPPASSQQQDAWCSPWETNRDSWWQWHPDWETFGENSTHTCFRPMANADRAAFLRQVYELQYHEKDCTQIKTRNIPNSGYAATINRLNGGFWNAFRLGHPFQITRNRRQFHWMYVPKRTPDDNIDNWAYCETKDQACYFLPISNCFVPVGHPEEQTQRRFTKIDLRNHQYREQYAWLQAYLTRPKHDVRRRLVQVVQDHQETYNQLQAGCTWIHIRRGDAMKEPAHPRKFHPLSEYLERGNVSKGETVLLLTDDELALEEAQWLHPNYHWVTWNRTRHRGVTDYNAHVPSNDPGHEVLTLLGEIDLAGRCTKGVHGTSNMVEMLTNSMIRRHGMEAIQLVQIEAQEEKETFQAQEFMDQFQANLEAQLQEAKEKAAAAKVSQSINLVSIEE